MNIFKAKRVEMKLSIDDVIKEIQHPVSVIESIERDELDFLPRPYRYYCAKTYAKFLDINNMPNVLKKYK